MNRESFQSTQTQDLQALSREVNTMRAEYLRSLFIRAGRSIGQVWTSVLSSIRAAQLMKELFALSDRELSDIGLTRSDIPALAAQISAGEPIDIRTAVSRNAENVSASVAANSDRRDVTARAA
jgi:uncharacterized protein YjiS (DUF1127 family)